MPTTTSGAPDGCIVAHDKGRLHLPAGTPWPDPLGVAVVGTGWTELTTDPTGWLQNATVAPESDGGFRLPGGDLRNGFTPKPGAQLLVLARSRDGRTDVLAVEVRHLARLLVGAPPPPERWPDPEKAGTLADRPHPGCPPAGVVSVRDGCWVLPRGVPAPPGLCVAGVSHGWAELTTGPVRRLPVRPLRVKANGRLRLPRPGLHKRFLPPPGTRLLVLAWVSGQQIDVLAVQLSLLADMLRAIPAPASLRRDPGWVSAWTAGRGPHRCGAEDATWHDD